VRQRKGILRELVYGIGDPLWMGAGEARGESGVASRDKLEGQFRQGGFWSDSNQLRESRPAFLPQAMQRRLKRTGSVGYTDSSDTGK